MKNIKDILNKLYDYYEVSGASELAKKIGVSPQVISSWKARNSINPLKTIIRQNGIYEKIFGEAILRNASDLVDRLMEFYDVSTISELAEKINIGHQAISKWRKNNSIDAIKKKSRELGIYDEIFKDFQENILILNMSNIQKTLNVIETMIKNNQELEKEFHQCLKSFVKDNL